LLSIVINGCLHSSHSKVALQYAGNTMPTVFEISLGAIDRGASLQFLSQYPDEEEILLPPRSYLEVIGGLSRKETDENGRVIKIVSLKVNANMSSSTIEQIEVGTAPLCGLPSLTCYFDVPSTHFDASFDLIPRAGKTNGDLYVCGG